MKILVVDDSVTIRKLIINILDTAGYDDVVQAGSGSEALESISDIDLILTDWNMPGMDGLTFVKEVRQNPETANVPIIMVTVEGSKDAVLEASKAGVNDYIIKPFTGAILLEKIKNLSKV